ncbi:uncharacterized protein V1518DRAFT_377074 [Limtongia smithiae]|uniref:uncharacterized protein n=1 Tax=Limtongia smithiae TaxID=1125753 RepID=UPI0034CE53F2
MPPPLQTSVSPVLSEHSTAPLSAAEIKPESRGTDVLTTTTTVSSSALDTDDVPQPQSSTTLKRSRSSASVTPVPKSQKPPGELLTAAEKKANHIASEQKRRQAIRDGFDRLTEVVPGLTKSQGRSEVIVLQKTLAFLKSKLDENRMLVQQITDLGYTPPSELAAVVNSDYHEHYADDNEFNETSGELSPP